MKCYSWCVTLVGLLVCAVPAQATLINMIANIDGLQETPPVATPATGFANITIDDVTGEMNVSGTYQDLIGTVTQAHIHGYAPPGTPAGVVFGLTIPVGTTSGAFSGMGTIPAGNIPNVVAGLTYVNIHTSFRTGGEIRGQVVVPEPGAVALFAGGAIAVVALRRRFRLVG